MHMSQELLSHFQSKKLSIGERIAAGKELRKEFPRIELFDYQWKSAFRFITGSAKEGGVKIKWQMQQREANQLSLPVISKKVSIFVKTH